MPSLKDFVAALQAGWFPALVAFVGCFIIIMGDFLKIPYLASSPNILLTLAVVIGVFSFSILIANVVYLPVLAWQVLQRRNDLKRFRAQIVQEIESAPESEKAILAYLVTTGRKAFVAEFNSKQLSPLVSKGFIIKLGGTNHILEWPHMVQQDVWEYLVKYKESFKAEIKEGSRDPFNWRNSGW